MAQNISFDINTTLKAAEFSQAAYFPDNEIYSFLISKGYLSAEIVEDKSTETLVFVAFNGEEIVVCSRGTQNLRNWLTDADIRMTYWGASYCVHRGFKLAHVSVWDRVLKTILLYHNKPHINILFCGHSLGASLSLLQFTAWREKYGVGNELCYNFGQPRTGNRAFARHVDDIAGRNTIFRHIHLDDPIPRVPYRMGKFQHNHCEEIYWNDKNSPIINPFPITKIPSDLDGILTEGKHFVTECGLEIVDKLLGRKTPMQGQILIPLLGDHFIIQYLVVLNNYNKLKLLPQ